MERWEGPIEYTLMAPAWLYWKAFQHQPSGRLSGPH